jgi:hypothetical protein
VPAAVVLGDQAARAVARVGATLADQPRRHRPQVPEQAAETTTSLLPTHLAAR